VNERENMSGPHDCGGDAAAYALGALTPSEAEAFARHLDECSICRDELDALRGVVEALPMASPQYPAPRRLRRRVLRAVRQEPRSGTATQPTRPRLRPARRGLLGAASLTIAVAAAVVLVLVSPSGGTGRLIQAQLTGVSGSAQLRIRSGRGELIVHHLTAPRPGRVYEVWLKSPHRNPVPASVLFDVSSAGNAEVGLPHSLKGISQVMVTSEPDGGSPAPTSQPVIVAQIS
jgi:anti-sigma-K factor RskA